MGSELVLSGVTFTASIAKALPSIPGLLSLGFFGTGFDGVNGNRVAGGASFTNPQVAPVFGSNYMQTQQYTQATGAVATVSGGAVVAIAAPTTPGTNYQVAPQVIFTGGGGSGASATAVISGGQVTGFTGIVGGTGYTSAPTVTLAGGNVAVLDLGVPRSQVLASGFTLACVVRTETGNAPAYIAADQNQTGAQAGFSATFKMENVNPSHGNSATLSLDVAATDNAFLILPSTTQSYRFVALTFAGSASGVFNIYSISDNLSATYTNPSISAASNQQMRLGQSIFAGNTQTPVDHSFVMQASGVLSVPTLQNIYASVKSLLARRNVTVL